MMLRRLRLKKEVVIRQITLALSNETRTPGAEKQRQVQDSYDRSVAAESITA
jgi:hypothetical protein